MEYEILANSDTDILRKVVMHVPDDGIERITPDNALRFLYDDIVFLPKMREEHSIFKNVIAKFIGDDNIHDTKDLLVDVLNDNMEDVKTKLLDYIFDHENCDEDVQEKIISLGNEDLAYTLFTGILKETDELVLPPLPNYIFTRDIGVVINQFVLICNASKRARTRETILTRAILYHHPIFKSVWQNNRLIDMTKKQDDVTIEGGDVMILDNEYLLVGCSERSTPEAFTELRKELFKKEVIDNVVRIVIPNDRAYMHIDTVFTAISENDIVIFEWILQSELIKTTVFNSKGGKQEFSTLREFFEFWNPDVRFILCGNGEYPYDEREQWTDGCNLVALKPGVAVAYGRNIQTNKALSNAGYEILKATEIIENNRDLSGIKKSIITISSSELSRARGGPHCMTFPILRG